MTEQSDQSRPTFGWHDYDETIAADQLGPFQLVATADYTLDGDGYAVVRGNVRLRLKDTNTDTFLIDEEVEPVMSEFTSLDHTLWKRRAEGAIEDAGYDLDALFASLQDDAA